MSSYTDYTLVVDKKAYDWDDAIIPLHPAVEDMAFKASDCYKMGMSCGVSPQIIAAIITGRSLPSPMVRKRLESFIPAERLEELEEDFNPTRDFIFSSKQPSKEINRWCNPIDIFPGDGIYTRGKGWLIVSGVDDYGSSVKIFSNDCLASIIRKDAGLIVSSSRVKDTGYKKKPLGRFDKSDVESVFGLYTDEQKRQDYFEKMKQALQK